MSTRRLPLTSNPNVANSPLRGTLAVHNSKRVRSHADVQREEAYGQPPPAKRQMIDIGAQARPSKSPSAQRSARAANQRQTSRAAGTDRSSHSVYKLSEKEIENIRQWQTQTRARFPKMVFYFESVPDEQRVKLAKQVTHFGAVSLHCAFSSKSRHRYSVLTTRLRGCRGRKNSSPLISPTSLPRGPSQPRSRFVTTPSPTPAPKHPTTRPRRLTLLCSTAPPTPRHPLPREGAS